MGALKEFRFLIFRVVLGHADAPSDEILRVAIIGTGHFLRLGFMILTRNIVLYACQLFFIILYMLISTKSN